MRRRSFLARALAALAGLCSGASTGGAAAERPRRQTSTYVRLDRVMPTAGQMFEPIDWFDQRPGDLVRARWVRDGRTEYWRVTGSTYWATLPDGRVVECVECLELTLGEMRVVYGRVLLARLNEDLAEGRVAPFQVIPTRG